MTKDIILSKQWIRLGATAGILSNLLFPLLILIDLPTYLEIALAGLFGVLFSLVTLKKLLHHFDEQK